MRQIPWTGFVAFRIVVLCSASKVGGQVGEASEDNLVGVRAAVAARAWREPVMLETWPKRPAPFMDEMLAVKSEYLVASLKVRIAEGALGVVSPAANEGVARFVCIPSVTAMSASN